MKKEIIINYIQSLKVVQRFSWREHFEGISKVQLSALQATSLSQGKKRAIAFGVEEDNTSKREEFKFIFCNAEQAHVSDDRRLFSNY